MCRGCWEEYGAPQIDTPAVRAAAQAIGRVYEFSCTGGNLHVLIDDWNLDVLCEEFVREAEDHDYAEKVEAELACIAALKPLSEAERASALGLYERFWGEQALPEPEGSPAGDSWAEPPTFTPIADILAFRRASREREADPGP